jgi:hypothetical protein
MLIEDDKKCKYFHISDSQKKNIRYISLNIRNKLFKENYLTISDHLSIIPFKAKFLNISFSEINDS